MIASAVFVLMTLAFLLETAWLAVSMSAAGLSWWPSSWPTRTVTSYRLGGLLTSGTVSVICDIFGACWQSPANNLPARSLSRGKPSAGPRRSGHRAPHVPMLVVVGVLTAAEVLIAARRLAGARPHLAAVAGIVHHEVWWRLCRAELTGLDVRMDGWDIRGRWFGVVVGATPRTGKLRRGETIPWRVIAAHIAPGNAVAHVDPRGPP
jgi:hypothetical protein